MANWPCSLTLFRSIVLKPYVLIALCASAAFGQPAAINWGQQKAEILQHYRDLVQIDTSPPGNETKAVEYLKKVLEAEGIATKTFALDPNRANLVARLKGNGRSARC